MPQSVSTYLRAAILETVLTFTPMISAVSVIVRPLRNMGPKRKKSLCLSDRTIPIFSRLEYLKESILTRF